MKLSFALWSKDTEVRFRLTITEPESEGDCPCGCGHGYDTVEEGVESLEEPCYIEIHDNKLLAFEEIIEQRMEELRNMELGGITETEFRQEMNSYRAQMRNYRQLIAGYRAAITELRSWYYKIPWDQRDPQIETKLENLDLLGNQLDDKAGSIDDLLDELDDLGESKIVN
jgi:hypothetical protein